MKNFKLLLLAFVAILGTSCGNDDDGPGFELNTANLAGTYEVTSLTGNATVEQQQSVGGTVTSTLTITSDTFTNTAFTFNANGTYTQSGSYRQTLVVRTPGSPDNTMTSIEEFDEEGTFAINVASRTVSFTDDFGDAEVFDISRFTANELWFTQDVNEVDGDVTIMGTSEIRLQRN